MEPNQKKYKGVNNSMILILREDEKSDIYHPLEVSLEEEQMEYNILGGDVADLYPYSEIMRQYFLYQVLQ